MADAPGPGRMYRGDVSAEKTPLELAALATAAVPGLRVAGLRPPQFSDEVVSVTGVIDTSGTKWTVVCPHDTVGGLGLASQTSALARLARAHDAGRLPFDVPRPAGFTRTAEGVRVMVHRDLGGRFMTEDDFADPLVLPASLARALAALHNLPDATYTGVDLPAYTAEECRGRHLALLDEVATTGAVPRSLWDRWESALEDVALWRFRTAPVHGDLQPTSILVEDGSVMGLTGFSSAHVGDPAEDVAWVLARSSDEFLDRFQEAYAMARDATDLHLMTRAQLLSELAVARWLAHGLHAEDDSVVADARQMLADLAAEVGDARLVRPPVPVVPPVTADRDVEGGATASGGPVRPDGPAQDVEGGATEGTEATDGEVTGEPPEGTAEAHPEGSGDEDPDLDTGPLPVSEAPTERLHLERP